MNSYNLKIALCLWWLLNIAGARAGEFAVLVAANPAYETVDAVYNEFNDNNIPNTTLPILNAYPPSEVEYLTSNRPENPPNPESNSGAYLRYLIISYPYPTDVTAVMNNFQNNPLIQFFSYDGIIQPIRFTPPNPVAGDDITVAFHLNPGGGCRNAQFFSTVNSQGLSTDVSLIGNDIILDAIFGVNVSPSFSFCPDENEPYLEFNLGSLEAGTYQVRMNLVTEDELFPFTDPDRGYPTISFVVHRGGVQQVSTLSTLTLLLLVSFILSIGILAAKRVKI